MLEYFKYIIFEQFSQVTIKRPEKWGGNLDFSSYAELEESFSSGKLHPMDLKTATAEYINTLIEPVRAKLAHNETAQKLHDEIASFKVTR
jgi:tyrosyl-tRNA synthetase